jgi:hypothetical protein
MSNVAIEAPAPTAVRDFSQFSFRRFDTVGSRFDISLRSTGLVYRPCWQRPSSPTSTVRTVTNRSSRSHRL